MGHVADGTLRRYLDEPAAVNGADQAHLLACPRCAAELHRADEDRTLVAGRLGALDLPAAGLDDLRRDQAWARLDAALTAEAGSARLPARAPVLAPSDRRRRRWLRGHPAAAALTAGLVLIGGTAAAAGNGWLPIFRAEKVAPVAIGGRDLNALGGFLDRLKDLSAYGDVTFPAEGPLALTAVPDAATAQARTGFPVPRVAALPAGVSGSPTYQVMQRQNIGFTLSAAKTAAAAAAGAKPMPAGLDGSRLLIDLGPGSVQTWTTAAGLPGVLVARMTAPTLSSQGAPLQVLLDYLLSLPGISPQLQQQLRGLAAGGSTLPIPIDPTAIDARQIRVGGADATLLAPKGMPGTAVIWVADGRLTAVLGLADRGALIEVARGLR